MSNLSVLILCGSSPRHFYVANRLCKAGRPVAIVQETGRQLDAAKIRKWIAKPSLLWRKVWRWLRERKRYAGNDEARFFFGDAAPRLDRSDLIVNVQHINHQDVIDLADKHKPDVIAVFGTSLIKSGLLSRGRLGMLNLHGGLSPHYRGADCTFWALYNGEPDQVGCTLHFINPGIDTGDLIAHVSPAVKDGDTEFELFWRAVKDSAEVYAEILDRLERGEPLGQRQEHKGRLYQVKDRLLRHERQLAAKLEGGMLRGVALPPRVTWFSKQSR